MFAAMVEKPPALTREQIKAEIETLENFYAPCGFPDLYPRTLILIDQVATHISQSCGQLPESCATQLHVATLAAAKQDITKLVTHLKFALSACDTFINGNNQAQSAKAQPKPLEPHTDKLLARLKQTKAPTS